VLAVMTVMFDYAVAVLRTRVLMPSVVLVSTVPAFVSSQEHAILAGSTPASFDDIPPVLCHKEENVSIVLEPPFEGFAEAHGTLFVLERCDSLST